MSLVKIIGQIFSLPVHYDVSFPPCPCMAVMSQWKWFSCNIYFLSSYKCLLLGIYGVLLHNTEALHIAPVVLP